MSGMDHYLDAAFLGVLRISWQAGLLVLLIVLAQALLRGKVSPGWRHAFWGLLLVRLVLVWSIPSPFSVHNLLPGSVASSSVAPVVVEPAEGEPGGFAAAMESGDLAAGGHREQPANGAVSALTIAALAWLGGAILLLGMMVVQAGKFMAREGANHPVAPSRVLELLDECKQSMGVTTRVAVTVTPRVKSPALLGFIRPRLLLPPGLLESVQPEEIRHIFLHELAHVKRGDIVTGWLLDTLVAVHWFNPVLWWARRRALADRELACDAHVLAKLEPDERARYGRSLLEEYKRFLTPGWAPNLAGILEGKTRLERRLQMIAQFTLLPRRAFGIGLLALLVLACVTLTDAKTQPVEGAAKDEFQVETTTDEDGRYIDKLDYPFVDDPKLVGTWTSVDFVSKPKQFKPGKQRWQGDLYLEELVFLPEGRTFRPWWTWTKGLVFHSGDRTAARYTLKDMAGDTYMFFEWKSGDYTIRHMNPKYYVLKKTSSDTGGLAESWAGQPSDEEFRKLHAERIGNLDLATAGLDDVIAVFGQPAQYLWESEQFTRDNLPAQYILVLPDDFHVYMKDNRIVELRYYHRGYTYQQIEVGTPLEQVIEPLGQPAQTVEGEAIGWKDGVLYKDIEGRKGNCYLQRPDLNVRMFFTGYKVGALYVTAPRQPDPEHGGTTVPTDK